MAAVVRNPRAGGDLQSLVEFPAGAPGREFFHAGFGEAFVYLANRWRALDACAAVYPAGAGVLPLTAVRLDGGVLELLDLSVLAGHQQPRATGVVVSVVGGDALVRWEGEVDGFEALTEGATYCADAEPGGLTAEPDPGLPTVRLGQARSSSRLYVHLDQPVLV